MRRLAQLLALATLVAGAVSCKPSNFPKDNPRLPPEMQKTEGDAGAAPATDAPAGDAGATTDAPAGDAPAGDVGATGDVG